MSLVRRHPLWAIVVAGVAIRLFFAFAFFGDGDVRALQITDGLLDRDFLNVYSTNDPVFLWPYPPGFFPGIEGASGLSDLTGLPFHGTVQLLPILADVGIALAIVRYLAWRGATESQQLAGAALVMFGPAFIAISGYHGQIDSVAILPAVIALIVWERRPAPGRALGAGALSGLGAAVKWVPLLIVLPLLPSARSWREAAKLVGSAAGVLALSFVPFLIVDPGGVASLRNYSGIPGLGGLSLVLDPSAASDWMTGTAITHRHTGVSLFVKDHAGLITLIGVLALAAFLFRYRPAPVDGAVLLWLVIYVFNPNFFMQYLVWGLPFFIMAGYLREVAILQLLLIPAIVVFELMPQRTDDLVVIYTPSMIALYAFWILATYVVAHRIVRRGGPQADGVQPPLIDIGSRRPDPGVATP